MFLLRIKSWIGCFLLCCPPWVNFQINIIQNNWLLDHLVIFAIWHSPGHEEGFQGARIEQDQLRPGSTVNWDGKTSCLCNNIVILTSRTIRHIFARWSLSHRKNDWCASPSSEWRSPPPCSASPQSLISDDCNTFTYLFCEFNIDLQRWPHLGRSSCDLQDILTSKVEASLCQCSQLMVPCVRFLIPNTSNTK